MDLIVWQENGVAFAQAGSGSFNGSPANSQYRLVWWRDTTRMIIGLQTLPDDSPSQPSINNVVDALWRGQFEFLRQQESFMDAIIHNPLIYNNEQCMPPRVDISTLKRPRLTEGPHKGAYEVRCDAQEPQWLGELLFYSAGWLKGGSGGNSPEAPDYLRLYNKAAKYLAAVHCFDWRFCNGWEEGADIYTSNIAASLAGLTAAREMGAPVPNKILARGRQRLEERLAPLRETDTRPVDLALLWLNRYNIVPARQMDMIAAEVAAELGTMAGVQRIMGIARHNKDFYQGKDVLQNVGMFPKTAANSEWPTGSAELARHFATRPGEQAAYKHWLAKAVEPLRVYGRAPEQLVPLHLNGDHAYRPGNLAFLPMNPTGWSAAAVLEALKT